MLSDDIRFLTNRALWGTENLMKCISDELWNKRYDGIPMWKYLYHTLYSMDRWYMNPCDSSYQNLEFYTETLADLNIIPKDECLKREQIENYFYQIEEKIKEYIRDLKDEKLSSKPENGHMFLIWKANTQRSQCRIFTRHWYILQNKCRNEANSYFAEVEHLAKKDEAGNISGIWGTMSDFSHSFNPWEENAGAEEYDVFITHRNWKQDFEKMKEAIL